MTHAGAKPRSNPCSKGLAALYAAVALIAAAPFTAHAAPEAPVPAIADQAPEFRISAGTVALPVVMVREFPFIEATIQGVKGKLMLDTGRQDALAVNDHRVQIVGGRKIGTGFFESGQTFDIRLAPELRDVHVNGLTYPRVTDVTTQDARQLERITPDFIGWMGYHAFEDHALKLDYRNAQATFYPRGADYLAGERVVAELPFETRRLPNHPVMQGRVGDITAAVTWDTGQQGGVYTTEAGKADLIAKGLLTPSADDPENFDLQGLVIDGHAMPAVLGVSVDTTPSPAARSIGITEAHEITLGYGLLRHFKTVWDFDKQSLYLLER